MHRLCAFLAIHAVTARLTPWPGLAAEGPIQHSCAWFGHAPNRSTLVNHLRRSQNPSDCSSARFMLLDEFNDQTGLGFSFLALHTILLQAVAENRTLLSTSSVLLPGATPWRWCDEGVRDYGCYFEPWSSCAAQLAREQGRSLFGSAGGVQTSLDGESTAGCPPGLTCRGGIPMWDGFGTERARRAGLQARVVRISLRDDHTQAHIHRLYGAWMRCIPAIGRSWWFSATWDVLFRFTEGVERSARDFLRSKGVRIRPRDGGGGEGWEGRTGTGTSTGTGAGPGGGRGVRGRSLPADGAGGMAHSGTTFGPPSRLTAPPVESAPVAQADPFIVVIVRHGGKHVEEKLVTVSEYLRPLEKLTSQTCFDSRNVLIITETGSVVSNFSRYCADRGWNCFWTDQRRLDLSIDPWNALDPRNKHGAAQQAALFSSIRRHDRSGERGERHAGGRSGLRRDEASRATQEAFASQAEMMHHIGWHSVLNLAVSAHAVALLGSFGSSWSQLTLSMMHRQHRAPVLGCSLRPGWKGDNMYTRFTPKGPPLVKEVSPMCRRAMNGLCKGGGKGEPGMMYEGWGCAPATAQHAGFDCGPKSTRSTTTLPPCVFDPLACIIHLRLML